MKLFIPAISTKLFLEQPWTFDLYSEDRNDTFITSLRENGFKIPKRKENDHGYYGWGAQLLCKFTLPIGTQLSVSRIYIRQGQKEFDSVSFTANFEHLNANLGRTVKIKGRFWAKLADVNEMIVEDEKYTTILKKDLQQLWPLPNGEDTP